MSRPSRRIRKSDASSAARSLPRLGFAPVWDDDDLDDLPIFPALVDRIFTSIPLPESAYLGYAQNDATILSASFNGANHCLVVNHYDVWRLASILSGSWTSNRSRFPVHYLFHGVTECHVLQQVEQGVFLKLRASLSDVGPSLVDIVSISPIGEDSAGCRYMIRANSARRFRRKGSPGKGGFVQETVVLVQCQRLEIRDESDKGWATLFDHRHDDLLQAFKAICPVTHWGIPDLNKWIAENA